MTSLTDTSSLPRPEQVLPIYTHLHAHPELSMQEHGTADYIEGKLSLLGLEVFRCGGTGVVGVLRNGAGPVIAYRADMDGLPVEEQTGLAYASVSRGELNGEDVPVMHACGHDIHMTVALLVAAKLEARKDKWFGTIVFIFQPGEETAAGAAAMIADGLWDRAPRPEVVLGQHVLPLALGEVHIAAGPVMSRADALQVTVNGRGSHGSQPEASVDPVVLSAAMILRLQTVIARETPPSEAAVLTVGAIHGGLKENVIPDVVRFTINIRTFSDPVRDRILEAVQRILRGEAIASGAPEPVIEELYQFPPCVNDVRWTQIAADAIAVEVGADAVKLATPWMASEDFALLGTSIGVPTVYWFVGGGTGRSPGSAPPVNHSPFFAPTPVPTIQAGTAAAVAAILGAMRVQN